MGGFGEHGPSSEGVEGEEGEVEGASGFDGFGNGVGDVVKFEVEEDATAALADFTHEVGAVGGEELETDFEVANFAVESVDPLEGFLVGGDVEG